MYTPAGTHLYQLHYMSTLTDLPRLILKQWLPSPSLSSVIPLWHLPSLKQMLINSMGKRLGRIPANGCSTSTSTLCSLKSAQTIRLLYPPLSEHSHCWPFTFQNWQTTTRANYCIKFLVGCDSLEADTLGFRHRLNGTVPGSHLQAVTLNLMITVHFILPCPSYHAPVHCQITTPKYYAGIRLHNWRHAWVCIPHVWIQDHASYCRLFTEF